MADPDPEDSWKASKRVPYLTSEHLDLSLCSEEYKAACPNKEYVFIQFLPIRPLFPGLNSVPRPDLHLKAVYAVHYCCAGGVAIGAGRALGPAL